MSCRNPSIVRSQSITWFQLGTVGDASSGGPSGDAAKTQKSVDESPHTRMGPGQSVVIDASGEARATHGERVDPGIL